MELPTANANCHFLLLTANFPFLFPNIGLFAFVVFALAFVGHEVTVKAIEYINVVHLFDQKVQLFTNLIDIHKGFSGRYVSF